MAVESVAGESVTVVFDGKKCIHARFCVTGAPKTFLANVEGPWIHPDATDAAHLIEVAHACPSGAVQYVRKDGVAEPAPQVNIARLRENGPVAVHAPMTLNGEAIGMRATLCRCGASKNKPYCDGSHTAAGFTATGEPESKTTEMLAVRDGPLTVTALKDGPLKVEGNLEICAGSGRVVQRGSTVFLCRCGASQNKPFCDGSHKGIGFTG
jgi:CDGSH-type Zn-finger protein/ferredoxin